MRIALLFIIILTIVGCKQKPSLTGNEPINFDDFAEAFPVLKLPFTVSDSTYTTVATTAIIPHELFRQFVPDSVLFARFGKDTSYVLRPVGKIIGKEKEDYLAIQAKGKQKTGVYLLVFKNKVFSAAMPFIESNKDDKFQSGSIDRKLSIIINSEWTEKDNLMYARTIYAYNNVGVFTTVLTETNVPPVFTASTVINPIDTFPKNNKFSGDYVKGKKNLVSIRDGSTANDYLFFVYFINEGENPCGGDLKGQFTLATPTSGVFNSSGDPCIIDFEFTKNRVKVKEQGSCGNYRGITCFFNDTYTLKKDPKPAVKKI